MRLQLLPKLDIEKQEASSIFITEVREKGFSVRLNNQNGDIIRELDRLRFLCDL